VWCGQIRAIPFKKTTKSLIPYLDRAEMDALLAAPDQQTSQGRRDYALLLFLYNSGARADEVAQLIIRDLQLDSLFVRILGKGKKERQCPLWTANVGVLVSLIGDREPSGRVFLNRCGRSITRFGIHTMVERYAFKARIKMPSLASKRVSPHSIRHSTASHLLHAGVDINTIRAWLGHVSLETTNIYAETNLEMKAKALAMCEIEERKSKRRWRGDPGLMTFLRSL
jgi:site-specific recombinase XerD